MKTQILKKITAVCLVLAISGAALACGGNGGGCGDKDKKGTATFTAQSETEKKADADKKGCCGKKAEGQEGCKKGESGSKECPKK